eukprot:COSAG01_NODE_4909_length_4634_cov_25.764498_1_plen_286_part_10
MKRDHSPDLGFATGTSCAGSAAHVFLEWLWRNCLDDPRFLLHLRYIDDGIGLFDGPAIDLPPLLHCLNEQHQQIQITTNIGYHYIVYLDIVFFRGPLWDATGFLDSDLYEKPTNTHLFFTFKSEHPLACKRGLITAEMARYVKRCSSNSRFLRHAINLWHHLRARGFTCKFLAKCFDAAATFADRDRLLQPHSDTDRSTPHCFILDYSATAAKLRLSAALHANADSLPTTVRHHRRLIAWRAAPKLRNLVTFMFLHPSPSCAICIAETNSWKTARWRHRLRTCAAQ